MHEVRLAHKVDRLHDAGGAVLVPESRRARPAHDVLSAAARGAAFFRGRLVEGRESAVCCKPVKPERKELEVVPRDVAFLGKFRHQKHHRPNTVAEAPLESYAPPNVSLLRVRLNQIPLPVEADKNQAGGKTGAFVASCQSTNLQPL
uniref:Uncharacterized protein n=1 Tax=Tetraselmis sp. GSL018 TaxID=582737 RepID=A0A061S8X8_9CHLO